MVFEFGKDEHVIKSLIAFINCVLNVVRIHGIEMEKREKRN